MVLSGEDLNLLVKEDFVSRYQHTSEFWLKLANKIYDEFEEGLIG